MSKKTEADVLPFVTAMSLHVGSEIASICECLPAMGAAWNAYQNVCLTEGQISGVGELTKRLLAGMRTHMTLQ